MQYLALAQNFFFSHCKRSAPQTPFMADAAKDSKVTFSQNGTDGASEILAVTSY
jgi:hypothetical protein